MDYRTDIRGPGAPEVRAPLLSYDHKETKSDQRHITTTNTCEISVSLLEFLLGLIFSWSVYGRIIYAVPYATEKACQRVETSAGIIAVEMKAFQLISPLTLWRP